MTKRTALGKGLSALIGPAKTPPAGEPVQRAREKEPEETGRRVAQVPLDRIVPNRYQARRAFDPAALEELAASISQTGIIQPLIVRPLGDGSGRFELIAGERRLRAAQTAGLPTVPAIAMQATDLELSLLSLIENLQREDLNPIDEAEGLRLLVDRFHLTQEQVAQHIGKSRSAVANVLRLLSLPDIVKNALAAGKLTEGHARALLALAGEEDILFAFNAVLARGLSVRETEAYVTRIARGGRKAPRGAPKTKASTPDPNLDAYLRELSELYGTRIAVSGDENQGKVEMHYFSRQDRDRLLEMLTEARK